MFLLMQCFFFFFTPFLSVFSHSGSPPVQEPGSVRELPALHRLVQPGSGLGSRAAAAGHSVLGVRALRSI